MKGKERRGKGRERKGMGKEGKGRKRRGKERRGKEMERKGMGKEGKGRKGKRRGKGRDLLRRQNLLHRCHLNNTDPILRPNGDRGKSALPKPKLCQVQPAITKSGGRGELLKSECF